MKKRLKTFLWAFRLAWKLDKKMLLCCFGINAVLSVLPAVILYYNQQIIEKITAFINLRQGTFHDLAGTIVILGLFMTVSGLSNRVNGDLLYMVMYDSYYIGMQETLMEKIQKIPYKVLKQRKTQEEYVAVINRAGSLTDLASSVCVLFGKLLTAVSLLTVVLRQSFGSFLIVLLYMLAAIFISSRFIGKQRVNMLEVRKNENIAAYFQELPMKSGVAKEIRIYDTYRDILKQWEKAFEKIEKQESAYVWGKEEKSFFNGLGLYVCMFVLCVYQIFQMAYGRMSVDAFLTIFLLCQNLSGTIRDITNNLISLDYGLFALERQRLFISDMPEMGNVKRKEEQRESSEDIIELREVSFAYEDKNVLNHINLKIRKGEIVALLGHNGSGKSTLSKVMIGQLQPNSGELFYHGQPYSKWSMQQINKNIGVYFQDFFLFHMSLRENIEIGSIEEKGKIDLLQRAVELGDVKKISVKLSKKLENLLKKDVDKSGAILSGGEQQKVGVARAFYGNKELLIFDEPAAALDPIAEIHQFENIRSSIKDRTAILISHRIGFARLADRIVVLQNGTIAEEGNHEELMNKKGVYYDFFNQQAQWYQE